jgi:DNA-directed RNA polymerase alpha subunit
MTEQEIRQALAKAEGEFIDRMVDVFRRAMTEAYMKGLMDGANLEHDDDAAEKRLAEEAEVLASGQEPLPHGSLSAKDNDEPLVKLKPEARLKRKVRAADFLDCKNIRRILNQLKAHNIDTYGDLARLTAADVMKWHNFGKGCFEELKKVMKIHNVEFRKV